MLIGSAECSFDLQIQLSGTVGSIQRLNVWPTVVRHELPIYILCHSYTAVRTMYLQENV